MNDAKSDKLANRSSTWTSRHLLCAWTRGIRVKTLFSVSRRTVVCGTREVIPEPVAGRQLGK